VSEDNADVGSIPQILTVLEAVLGPQNGFGTKPKLLPELQVRPELTVDPVFHFDCGRTGKKKMQKNANDWQRTSGDVFHSRSENEESSEAFFPR
jgi:hypothetical protein